MYAAIMLVSLVLAVLSVISVVKNLLVQFNVSDNGWKTVAVVILLVICLLTALVSYSEAFTIKDIKAILSVPEQATEESIRAMEKQLPTMTTNAIVSICIGYAAYVAHWQLLKKIHENKLKQIQSNVGTRWADRV